MMIFVFTVLKKVLGGALIELTAISDQQTDGLTKYIHPINIILDAKV